MGKKAWTALQESAGRSPQQAPGVMLHGGLADPTGCVPRHHHTRIQHSSCSRHELFVFFYVPNYITKIESCS